jgi:hypothetical protein
MAITFTPASSATVVIPVGASSTFEMPAVDGSNQDTTVKFTGAGPLYLSFAAGAPVGPNVQGNLVVMTGQQVLLTSNAAVLAAARNQLIQSAPAVTAAAAIAGTALCMGGSASVTITRGTAVATETF